MRPTELVIFGNPKGGTPLMQSVQTVGIDLPLKALVWQDAAGDTWLSYNDPTWLAQRHGLGGETEPAINVMTGARSAIAQGAPSGPKPPSRSLHLAEQFGRTACGLRHR